MTQTANVLDECYMLGVDKAAMEDKSFVEVADKYLGSPKLQDFDAPLMLATLISLRGVTLRDFVWAGLDERSADLNDKEQLVSCIFGNPVICNLYNKPIR